MKRLIVLLLFAVVFTQLVSCAIHRKFPYICFKKECVLGQLGYYSVRESFKRAKINASVRKHKRVVKRNVKRGRKGLDPPYDLVKEKKQSDSLTYLGGFAGICKEIKLVLSRSAEKDTIIVSYLFEEKDLSSNEKEQIKNLVQKTGAAALTEIAIVNCHKRSVLSEHEAMWMDERARKIKKYLKSLGIPESKVTLEE